MERLATKVVLFERELIRAGADPEYVSNPFYAYNPYSTDKVAKHLPIIDLPAYLSAFAIRSFPENITVTHPPYLKSVSKLVEDTPDYVLSAYFITRLALSFATALGPKTGVRAESRRLEEVLRGIKKGTEENREDVCLSWVDSVLGYIAGREFVREAFSPEAKKDGEDIINCQLALFSQREQS
jgi:endothelin-converting enzyme